MCFLTQVTDDGMEALIAWETQSPGFKNLHAPYTMAQANMGTMREKIKIKREEMGHDDISELAKKVMAANIRQEQRKGGKWRPPCPAPSQL